MKKLYFDCAWGISGDMVLEALTELTVAVGICKGTVEREMDKLELCGHEHHHDHSHRSYKEIKQLIGKINMRDRVKEKALSIYAVIAAAEAEVHETSLEEVHFHEVGRDRAVLNILGVALCIDMLDLEEICCGTVYDGTGFIDCSHGRIPVPVPAVMAMRKDSALKFDTADVKTELVTPTGLAMLIGLGAAYAEKMPEGTVIKTVKAQGSRNPAANAGLAVTLLEA